LVVDSREVRTSYRVKRKTATSAPRDSPRCPADRRRARLQRPPRHLRTSSFRADDTSVSRRAGSPWSWLPSARPSTRRLLSGWRPCATCGPAPRRWRARATRHPRRRPRLASAVQRGYEPGQRDDELADVPERVIATFGAAHPRSVNREATGTQGRRRHGAWSHRRTASCGHGDNIADFARGRQALARRRRHRNRATVRPSAGSRPAARLIASRPRRRIVASRRPSG
jgi:hypothetical protein